MMIRRFYLIFTIILTISCSEDEVVLDSNLDGRWVLENVSCFCGFPEDFNFNSHALTFDSSSGIITLENDDPFFFISQEGQLSYSTNGNILNVAERQYEYRIEENRLVLDFVDNPNITDDEITLFYFKG